MGTRFNLIYDKTPTYGLLTNFLFVCLCTCTFKQICVCQYLSIVGQYLTILSDLPRGSPQSCMSAPHWVNVSTCAALRMRKGSIACTTHRFSKTFSRARECTNSKQMIAWLSSNYHITHLLVTCLQHMWNESESKAGRKLEQSNMHWCNAWLLW